MNNQYAILLVDDEPEVRRALRRCLRAQGYTIFEADSATAGIELIKLHPLDAVVSDYHMRGINGLDFLQTVRLLRPNAVRLLVTGQADVQLAARALNEGAVDRFVLKPWDNVDLRGIVQVALHARAGVGTAPPTEPK